MSYDLRIAVKDEYGLMVVIAQPERSSPTYNIGTMFRKVMDWDFNQSEFYPLKDVYWNITKGIERLKTQEDKYKKYNSPNGWGTTQSALAALESLKQCIDETVTGYGRWEEIPIDHLYVAW